MIILPFTAVILAHILGIITSVTDIKENKISNRLLLLFGITGIILTIAQYILKTNILWGAYFLNLTLVVVFSMVLYILHIWAAGDSKLLIVLGILLPANYCMLAGKIVPWSVLVVALSFIVSFIYLLAESVWLFITHRGTFSLKNVTKSSKQFFTAYVRNIIYISFALKLENFFAKDWFNEHSLAILGINISLILLISSFEFLKKFPVVAFIFVLSIALSVYTGEWFLSVSRLIYYLLVVIIMLLRIMISEYNYATIPTSEVKKGMILSSVTTVFMSKSRVKGLPGISREDMRSRLSAEEAEAVVRWSKTKNGLKEVQIVRKVPYAIFIFSGLLIYSVLWGLSI
ncbi:preflagellin peptidase FlaK [Butyrivibrio proteoclasticus]|uniref:Preflagellin peptidase FlaK n=1 Tax=Butyrivibrio proteoclasticus TaxID=43305 RepID=A0A1I5VIM8_9FIRM|nr:prepilin peptidase [Butyrivibrio proteoclasticus]SFQ07414.1 preflagellin peptidase FlaK [Butyrivibrio proteoclasticus]